MLFNSLVFPVFFILVLTLHWALRGRVQRNLLLLAASYVFYGWWDVRFLGLILLSSAVDYVAGLRIHAASEPRTRRAWLTLSLVANLGLLATFKYLNFFVESAEAFLRMLGLTPDWPTLHILLPVGISFYTFQTLSYTIDVYRGRMEPTRSVRDFFLYVAFFPQLVAGPIERAVHLLPQFLRQRHFDRDLALRGMRAILLGYFLKVVLADNMGPIVDAVYAAPEDHGALDLFLAGYCFAFQIYGDFAGYSWIAIGTAALLGVDLMTNFRSPFLAQSTRELWTRWHISMSSWFRDYLFIEALGGSRVSPPRRVVNLLTTYAVTGFWHGANWTFVIWGLINGLLYFVPAPLKQRSNLAWIFNALLCFTMFSQGTPLFRGRDIEQAAYIYGRLFGLVPRPGDVPIGTRVVLAYLGVAGVLMLAEWVQRKRDDFLDLSWLSPFWRGAVYASLVAAMVFLGEYQRRPFIYFQF